MLSTYFAIILINSVLSFADGSSGCPDNAVKFVCQCVENSRIVATTYSECIDQTAHSYERKRRKFESSCENQSTDTKDCVII